MYKFFNICSNYIEFNQRSFRSNIKLIRVINIQVLCALKKICLLYLIHQFKFYYIWRGHQNNWLVSVRIEKKICIRVYVCTFISLSLSFSIFLSPFLVYPSSCKFRTFLSSSVWIIENFHMIKREGESEQLLLLSLFF